MEGREIHGSNNLVEYNEVWGSVAYHTPTGCTGDADGFRFFGSGHMFRGNYIHDISYNDLENQGYSPHIDAFQTWADAYHAAASNILIEKNFIYLPGYKDAQANCHGFMLEDCSGITIRNNIVITHGGTNTGGGNVDHVKILNNTFIGNLSYLRSNYPVGISLQNCPNSTIKNNIVYDQADWAIYLAGTTYTGLDIGNNCTYNSDGSIPLGAPYPHDLWGIDPLFVNANNYDFHLKMGSPCIDAGATLSDVWDDYDNYSRPSGTAFDFGAFEYQGGSAPTISTQPQSQTIQSGQTAALNVSAAGTGPITYQWYTGTSGNTTNPISGATSSLYTTNSLTTNTNYWVRVSNTYGNTDSYTAMITVLLPPTVTTTAVSSLTQTGAVSGGTVTSDGGAPVTARGICWSTSANPTTANSKSTDGAGIGSYTSNMTGLIPNTVYHVRAYATNSAGTGYGADLTFRTRLGGTKSDFSGDGKADILWRNYATGQNSVWVMNGTSYTSEAALMTVSDTNWEIAGTGDFNGDEKTDILWRYYGTGPAQGYNVVWYMDGKDNIGADYVAYPVTDTNWKIAGVGDFNADGKPDIFWRYYGTGPIEGNNVVWYMDGKNLIGADSVDAVADTNWRIEGVDDFNGDGKPDLLWRYYGRDRAQGYNVIWFMDGKTNTLSVSVDAVPDLDWRIGGVGDFNGDGETDILWRYYGTGPAQGYNVLWYMNGATYAGYDYVYPVYDDRYWTIVNR